MGQLHVPAALPWENPDPVCILCRREKSSFEVLIAATVVLEWSEYCVCSVPAARQSHRVFAK